jgi:hypothetical protein
VLTNAEEVPLKYHAFKAFMIVKLAIDSQRDLIKEQDSIN